MGVSILNKRLPEDVKQTCLWLVRGYERRRRLYKDLSAPGKRRACRKCAKELERVEAVENALESIGGDIESMEVRLKLRTAMLQNIRSGRRYPYEKLGLDAVSRSDFYRRKNKFLADVAERMGMI